MKVVAIIEARLGSSRLPGKVLKEAAGKPLLQHLVERLRRAKMLQDVVIATTENPNDEPIELLAKKIGASFFRGSETDVLDRVLRAAESVSADVVVEVTGDCPLADPAVVDLAIDTYLNNKADFFGNRNVNPQRKTYPDGFGVRVFSTKILEEAARLTSDPADREHVSIYISDRPEKYKLVTCESGLPERYWPLRFTLDTIEDYKLIRRIFDELYPQNPGFSMQDVLRFVDGNPDLLKLNAHVREKPIR